MSDDRNPSNSRQRDSIYSTPLPTVDAFRFDHTVADVFTDMIERSVPGYSKIIQMIEIIAHRHAQPNTHHYDLGCSLGASTLAMRRGVDLALTEKSDKESVRIIGIDNSAAMIQRCHRLIEQDNNPIAVELFCKDIEQCEIQNAAMVTLNFTLQFIPVEKRLTLLNKVHKGLNQGGALVLSEKVCFENPVQQEILENLHYDFKAANGYSEMEISQKRTALENVLVPETIEVHKQRLNAAGFSTADVWFQCFNFISLIAYK